MGPYERYLGPRNHPLGLPEWLCVDGVTHAVLA